MCLQYAPHDYQPDTTRASTTSTIVATVSASGATSIALGTQGDLLAFDQPELRVKAGMPVTLHFSNNASAMAHNWVLTQPDQASAVASDGLAASEANGWLKADDARVIAATRLIKPGQSATLTFAAPVSGRYPFICSFPGHSALMHGTLIVE